LRPKYGAPHFTFYKILLSERRFLSFALLFYRAAKFALHLKAQRRLNFKIRKLATKILKFKAR
jgi:hypothetical protein